MKDALVIPGVDGDTSRIVQQALRDAFWKEFHKSGEWWFDHLGTEDECQQCTEQAWNDFAETFNQILKEESKPQPPPPPLPKVKYVCSGCGCRVIDGKRTCSCREMDMLVMALALGTCITVLAWVM